MTKKLILGVIVAFLLALPHLLVARDSRPPVSVSLEGDVSPSGCGCMHKNGAGDSSALQPTGAPELQMPMCPWWCYYYCYWSSLQGRLICHCVCTFWSPQY